MGSQSSKLVTESQLKKEHLVQLSNNSNSQASQGMYSNYQVNTPPSKKEQSTMVNTFFKWNFGGNTVFVTGTFSQWVNHVQLHKQGQEFSVCVRLPPGIHQYKFIVDDEWRFSPEDSQTTDENGNINNIIDTSEYEQSNNFYLQESHARPIPPAQRRAREEADSFDNFEFDRLNINKNTRNTPATGQPYSNQQSPAQRHNAQELQNDKFGLAKPRQLVAPEFNFKDKAPLCPPHIKEVYFMRQKEKQQLRIWKERTHLENMTEDEKQKVLSREKGEVFVDFFNSDHSLAPPQHVTTKHTGVKTVKNQPYNIYCMTQRFKQKYSTFKFFTSQYVENTDKLFLA